MKEKKAKKRRLPRIMAGAADGSKTYTLLPFQVRAANPIYFPKRSQVIKNKQRRKRQGK